MLYRVYTHYISEGSVLHINGVWPNFLINELHVLRWNCWKTVSELHFSTWSMSMIAIPALNAADVNAPCVECAPNMEESILALSETNHNHLAIKLEVTALYKCFLPSRVEEQFFPNTPEGYYLLDRSRVLCLLKRKGRRNILPLHLLSLLCQRYG